MPYMDSAAPVEHSDNSQIARAAGTVMVAILLGQAFSLLSSIYITRAFGTGMQNEAFNRRQPPAGYSL